MRNVTRIALFFGLVGALAGGLAGACSSKQKEPPPPAPREGLEIVRPGAIPHQPLRYQLTKGVKTGVEMEVDMDIVTPTFQRTMPTTVTVMELGAEDVLPDGSAKVRTTILRASARERPGAGAALEAVNAQAMMLSGVSITGTLTPRGRMQDPKLGGSENLPAKAAEGFAALIAQAEEVALPLPEPSVGVGAVWRVRRDAVQLGIKMETMTEISVTAIEGKRITFEMRTEVKGASQRTTIEGVPVDVSNVRGRGTGKGVIDLGRMAMFGEQDLELGFDMAAMGQNGSVKMRTAKRLRPAPEAAAAAPAGAKAAAETAAAGGKAEATKAVDKAPHDPGAH